MEELLYDLEIAVENIKEQTDFLQALDPEWIETDEPIRRLRMVVIELKTTVENLEHERQTYLEAAADAEAHAAEHEAFYQKLKARRDAAKQQGGQ